MKENSVKTGANEASEHNSSASERNAHNSANVVMDEVAISHSLTRIAHEIIERNDDLNNMCLVGIVTRGDVLACELSDKILKIENIKIPTGSLDISFYRDDISARITPEVYETQLPASIDGKNIILVDDVLYTGRTIRSALDAIMDYGRPDRIQLAVLVDRGHRELPIRPDYVGKNIPTNKNQQVRLYLERVDGYSAVEVSKPSAADEHVGAASIDLDAQGHQNSKKSKRSAH